jgi:hypothetical protein
MTLWWAQLVLNFLWTQVFFAAHRIDLALIVILFMLAAILGFLATGWRLDRVAAWLLVRRLRIGAKRLDLDVELTRGAWLPLPLDALILAVVI